MGKEMLLKRKSSGSDQNSPRLNMPPWNRGYLMWWQLNSSLGREGSFRYLSCKLIALCEVDVFVKGFPLLLKKRATVCTGNLMKQPSFLICVSRNLFPARPPICVYSRIQTTSPLPSSALTPEGMRAPALPSSSKCFFSKVLHMNIQ